MLPYILAAVGGYLIGTSSKKLLPDEAIFADGGDIYDLGDLTDVDEWDDRSAIEAILKAIDKNDFKYEMDANEDGYEYSAETKVMTRFDLPFEVKFEVEMEIQTSEEGYYNGVHHEYEIEISGYEYDFKGLYKNGVIKENQYKKIMDFFASLKKYADQSYE